MPGPIPLRPECYLDSSGPILSSRPRFSNPFRPFLIFRETSLFRIRIRIRIPYSVSVFRIGPLGWASPNTPGYTIRIRNTQTLPNCCNGCEFTQESCESWMVQIRDTQYRSGPKMMCGIRNTQYGIQNAPQNTEGPQYGMRAQNTEPKNT